MVIICPSVRHTGHNFMRWRIFESAFIGWPPHKPVPNDGYDYVLMGHFTNDFSFNALWAEFGQKMDCFIPLRHPARVLESFNRRGVIGDKRAEFMREWETMMRLVPRFKHVMYLHLDDHKIRKKQARDILQHLNFGHHIDWSVGTSSGSNKGTHDLELTDELLAKIPQSYIDFYENMKY